MKNRTFTKFISLLIILLSFSVFLQGQDVQMPKETVDYYEIAESLYENEKYYEAIDYYQKALEENRRLERDEQLHYHLANCYRNSRLYKKAKTLYQDLSRNHSRKFPHAMYYLGLMEMALEEYQEAINSFNDFLTSPKGNELSGMAKKKRNECEEALAVEQSNQRMAVELPGEQVNQSSYSNYGGIVHHDTLWFTGTYITNKGGEKIKMDVANGKYRKNYKNRLFFSAWNENTGWKEKQLVEIPGIKPEWHVLSPAFGPGNQYLFFTVCREENNSESCQIFRAKRTSRQFDNATALNAPINIEGHSSKHPWLIKDQGSPLLFFVSDRPESKGGYDLYYCYMDDLENCDTPTNPDKLNTVENEYSPFYDENLKKLYYSTKGHKGLGGYDIVYSEGNPRGNWSDPINAGIPANSGADDYYYFHRPWQGQYQAWVSTNRENGIPGGASSCCDQLVTYDFTPDMGTHYYFIARFYDSTTKEPLPFVTAEGQPKSKEEEQIKRNSSSGNQLIIKLNRSVSWSFSFSKNGYKNTRKTLPVTSKDTVKADSIFLAKISQEPLDLPTIYYEHNEHQLSGSEKEKLDKLATQLKNDYSDLDLYVSSHTDNLEAKPFNLELSEKRTKTVIDYLTSKGIKESRLTGQWWGEEKPAAPNQRKDGSDNPEGRKQNNRTVFIDEKEVTDQQAGPMVEYEEKEEFKASEEKQRAAINLDEATFEDLLSRYGDLSKEGLEFKVQIGAYLHPKKYFEYRQKMHQEIEKSFNVDINSVKDEGFTKYLATKPRTLNQANELKIKIREKSIPNAFIVPYYQGKRISIVDAIELLAK